MPTEAPILAVASLTKRFGGVTALEGVGFDLHRGEVLALAGDNGAGKSTLIKAISGVHQPDEGEIVYKGERVTLSNPRHAREIGIETIYQDLALADNLDVGANIFLGREPAAPLLGFLPRLDRKRMRAAAREVLATLEIDIAEKQAGPAGAHPVGRPAPGRGHRPRHLLEGRAPDHGRADRRPGRARAAQGGRADPPACASRTWP